MNIAPYLARLADWLTWIWSKFLLQVTDLGKYLGQVLLRSGPYSELVQPRLSAHDDLGAIERYHWVLRRGPFTLRRQTNFSWLNHKPSVSDRLHMLLDPDSSMHPVELLGFQNWRYSACTPSLYTAYIRWVNIFTYEAGVLVTVRSTITGGWHMLFSIFLTSGQGRKSIVRRRSHRWNIPFIICDLTLTGKRKVNLLHCRLELFHNYGNYNC